MRFVLHQLFTKASIVGSIEAPTLRIAADIGRVMCDGSFHVCAWDVAFPEHQAEAERRDSAADVAEEAIRTRC